MLESQAALAYHVNKYYTEQTLPRKVGVSQTVQDIGRIVKTILNEVEQQEPRFISSLSECDGRLEGLEVISPVEYEVVLYLNQMGVFSLVEDGTLPGCAMLKLSDGRKRSMSLWVEFITASGYLSARKVRSRFQTLVTQGIDKAGFHELTRLVTDTSDVRLVIRESIVVRLTPAFKCTRLWPQSAAHWPDPQATTWPFPSLVADIKQEGFSLLSKEAPLSAAKHSSAAESDAWVMSFVSAEEKLIGNGSRRKCLSILKTLRDRHLDFPGSPLNNTHMKTVMLYEYEKHPRDEDWDHKAVGDRIQGVLLQLVSCLRCRRLPHYFIPSVDLFAVHTTTSQQSAVLDVAAREVWCLAREIITNHKSFDRL